MTGGKDIKIMKTETIYKVLYNYAKNLPEVKNLDETLKKWIITDPKKPGYGGASDIINLLANLQQDIRTAANKANGKGNIEKALNKIVKSAKATNPHGKILHGVFLSEGLPAACDGYKLIRAFEPFEIGEPAEGIDLANILNPAKQNNDEPLQLPTAGELKAYITLKKAEGQKNKDIEYDFGKGLPLVNSAYLLDMLQVFNEAFYNKNNLASPIYFKGVDGEGVLCPIRRQEAKK